MYDTFGNVFQHDGKQYLYDALNMMKESTDGGRRLYVYTASDERIAVVYVENNLERSSEWTLRDASNRVLRRFGKDVTGTWHWKEDYIYGGTRLLAAEVPESERVRHFHLDHLGTPRLITGNGGAKLVERTYDPFGRKVTDATGDLEQLEFTGHERDSSALDYMHARYYQPELGRFLSVDPVLDREKALKEPQRWNRYSYVINNPLRYRDPDGRQMKPTCTVDNCPPPAPIETVLRITPQNLARTAQANANKPPTITSTAGTPPTPGLVTVTGGVSVNFVALGGGNAGVGVMHANRVGTQHAALYAEGGVHTPSPRGSAGIQATIGIFRGGVTDQRGSFTNANFTIMQLGVTLAFTKAGGLVGVSGSWGPSVGAGYSTSESNTVLVTGDKVLEKIGVDQ